jgi:hypothetical protein
VACIMHDATWASSLELQLVQATYLLLEQLHKWYVVALCTVKIHCCKCNMDERHV